MTLTGDYVFITIILLAMGLTFLSFRYTSILLRSATFLIWLALTIMMFTGVFGTSLEDTWVQILVWIFLVLSIMMLLMQMDTEILHEAKGRRWYTFDREPREKPPSSYQGYAERLRRRLRGGR